MSKISDVLLGGHPEFVMISTGRAGSTYLAHLFTSTGISCCHEGFYTPSRYKRKYGFRGDCSWLAVPYLERSEKNRPRVCHHTRHPLEVISSLYGIRFFDGKPNTKFKRFAYRNFSLTGDELLDCARWWIDWNKRCERLASFTFRIECVDQCFDRLLTELNIGTTYAKEKFCGDFANKKINSRLRKPVKIKDIPEGQSKDELFDLAQRYGYSV